MSIIDEARALLKRAAENTLDEGHSIRDYEEYEDEKLDIGESALSLLEQVVAAAQSELIEGAQKAITYFGVQIDMARGVIDQIEESREAESMDDVFDARDAADDVLTHLTVHGPGLLDKLRLMQDRAAATTREDSAPESIAHEVIRDRYGDWQTFDFAMITDPKGLGSQAVLDMLKDAAARGLDAREED